MSARNEWFFALRDFTKERRIARRDIHPQELTPQQFGQYRIHGGTIVNWVQQHGPSLLSEREVLKHLRWWDGDPFVVILSDLPGLVAAEQIIPPSAQHLCGLAAHEYREFLSSHPDADYKWHVTFETVFNPLTDPALLARAHSQYPLAKESEHWLHKEDSILGKLFTRTGLHLWKWERNEYHLLEEAFVHYIS